MTVLGATVTGPALPAIQHQLGLSVNGLEWFGNAYLVTTAAPLVPAGRLGDRIGRFSAYNLGVVVYAGGAVASAAAQDGVWIVVSSAVQGVGGALLATQSLSLLDAACPQAGPQPGGRLLHSSARGRRDPEPSISPAHGQHHLAVDLRSGATARRRRSRLQQQWSCLFAVVRHVASEAAWP